MLSQDELAVLDVFNCFRLQNLATTTTSFLGIVVWAYQREHPKTMDKTQGCLKLTNRESQQSKELLHREPSAYWFGKVQGQFDSLVMPIQSPSATKFKYCRPSVQCCYIPVPAARQDSSEGQPVVLQRESWLFHSAPLWPLCSPQKRSFLGIPAESRNMDRSFDLWPWVADVTADVKYH